MSLWIVDGGMIELPVVARVEDWKEGSYIEIVGSDDGAKWNDVPIRYVAERTCHIVKTWSDSDFVDGWRYRCSECMCFIPVIERDPETGDVISAANYCPNCGRRVVAGDA